MFVTIEFVITKFYSIWLTYIWRFITKAHICFFRKWNKVAMFFKTFWRGQKILKFSFAYFRPIILNWFDWKIDPLSLFSFAKEFLNWVKKDKNIFKKNLKIFDCSDIFPTSKIVTLSQSNDSFLIQFNFYFGFGFFPAKLSSNWSENKIQSNLCTATNLETQKTIEIVVKRTFMQ